MCVFVSNLSVTEASTQSGNDAENHSRHSSVVVEESLSKTAHRLSAGKQQVAHLKLRKRVHIKLKSLSQKNSKAENRNDAAGD